MLFAINNQRPVKILLCLILIINIIGSSIITAYCGPAVVPLIEWGIPIVAKILVTAGLTFGSIAVTKLVAEECIEAMPADILEEFELQRSLIAAAGYVFEITDSIWSWIKNWVNQNFIEGENTIEYESGYEYEYDVDEIWKINESGPKFIMGFYGVSTQTDYYRMYEYKYDPISNLYKCYVTNIYDGTGTIYAGDGDVSKNTYENFEYAQAYKYFLDGYYYVRYKFKTYDGAYIYKTVTVIPDKCDFSKVVFDEVVDDVVIGQSNTFADSTYDYINGYTEDRSICIDQDYADVIINNPESVNDDVINPVIDNLLNETYSSISAEIPSTVAEDTGILHGILTKTGEIVGALTGSITGVLSNINTKVESISNALVDPMEREIELEEYNLPDLFLLLIAILLAILRLFLAILAFVIQVNGIPSDNSLIPETARQVIVWIKTENLPGFNLCLMDIIVPVFTVMLGIQVAKVLKKNIIGTGERMDKLYKRASLNKED